MNFTAANEILMSMTSTPQHNPSLERRALSGKHSMQKCLAISKSKSPTVPTILSIFRSIVSFQHHSRTPSRLTKYKIKRRVGRMCVDISDTFLQLRHWVELRTWKLHVSHQIQIQYTNGWQPANLKVQEFPPSCKSKRADIC